MSDQKSQSAPRVLKLPESLVLKMAAGEIVERPASVVKELVENSVDAGASRIDVEIGGAGVESITVADDGCGIEPEDLRLAVGSHATSKLSSEEQLHAVTTLGFRGEALASMAAVSRLEIVSRVAGRATGGRILIEGGVVIDEGPAGARSGTVVTVKEIFFNTPVRRKFLRTPQTETARVIEAVTRIALGHSEVHFTLKSQGRELLRCPAAATLRERAAQVLGDAATQLFDFESDADGMRLFAACAGPSMSRGDMSFIHTLVNGRHITDKGMRRVIADSFRNVLPSGRYPFAVVSMKIPAEDVDVNVHPQKTEVRFLKPSRVYGFAAKAITSALAGAPWLEGRKYVLDAALAQTVRQHGGAQPGRYSGVSYPVASVATAQVAFGAGAMSIDLEPERKGFFSSREYRGQLWGMYLVYEGPVSVVFVDQHAAHERLAFMEIMKAFSGGSRQSQMMLIPGELSLSPRHAALVGGQIATLDAMGISVEPFGASSIMVRGMPPSLEGADPATVIADVVDELEATGQERSISAVAASIASRIACHAVVRGTHALSAHEALELARRLDRVDFGVACPHGRPVYFELSRAEVEKRFGRR
ncbi:MAG: DNA mismatch repair endonuclease MutL [Myxococcota bacterium]|jgi:DNA mismatch repair protein MutL